MSGSRKHIRLAAAAAIVSAAAIASLPLSVLAEGEATSEGAVQVTVIPAGIVFAILSAAIVLGVAAGYWFSRRKK